MPMYLSFQFIVSSQKSFFILTFFFPYLSYLLQLTECRYGAIRLAIKYVKKNRCILGSYLCQILVTAYLIFHLLIRNSKMFLHKFSSESMHQLWYLYYVSRIQFEIYDILSSCLGYQHSCFMVSWTKHRPVVDVSWAYYHMSVIYYHAFGMDIDHLLDWCLS